MLRLQHTLVQRCFVILPAARTVVRVKTKGLKKGTYETRMRLDHKENQGLVLNHEPRKGI